MTEIEFLVEEAIKGGYIARAIGFSIFTEAGTMEELKINIQEAIDCHFDTSNTPNFRLKYNN
jgi:predicted RNase H-like HicB family nuclease